MSSRRILDSNRLRRRGCGRALNLLRRHLGERRSARHRAQPRSHGKPIELTTCAASIHPSGIFSCWLREPGAGSREGRWLADTLLANAVTLDQSLLKPDLWAELVDAGARGRRFRSTVSRGGCRPAARMAQAGQPAERQSITRWRWIDWALKARGGFIRPSPEPRVGWPCWRL